MASTLLLDRDTWDLCIDALGNMALATEPYSIEQDVASACRLFTSELYYGGAKGISYFKTILGRPISERILKSEITNAALGVPGVKSVQVFFESVADRSVGGQVQITTSEGTFTVAL
jgi:hypothetical protein